jgi:hypothetical protein
VGKLSIHWIDAPTEFLDRLEDVKHVDQMDGKLLRVENGSTVHYINLEQTKEVYFDLGLEI